MKAAASDIGLTPRGRLVAVPSTDAPILDARLVESLERAFQRGSGHVLFSLGARETEAILPPSYAYWRDFGGKYVNALCTRSEGPAEGGIMDVVWPGNSIYLKQREIIPGVVDNETTRCQSAWTRSVSC